MRSKRKPRFSLPSTWLVAIERWCTVAVRLEDHPLAAGPAAASRGRRPRGRRNSRRRRRRPEEDCAAHDHVAAAGESSSLPARRQREAGERPAVAVLEGVAVEGQEAAGEVEPLAFPVDDFAGDRADVGRRLLERGHQGGQPAFLRPGVVVEQHQGLAGGAFWPACCCRRKSRGWLRLASTCAPADAPSRARPRCRRASRCRAPGSRSRGRPAGCCASTAGRQISRWWRPFQESTSTDVLAMPAQGRFPRRSAAQVTLQPETQAVGRRGGARPEGEGLLVGVAPGRRGRRRRAAPSTFSQDQLAGQVAWRRPPAGPGLRRRPRISGERRGDRCRRRLPAPPSRRPVRAAAGRWRRLRWSSTGQPAAEGVEETGAQREPGFEIEPVGGGQHVDLAQEVVAPLEGHPVERLDRGRPTGRVRGTRPRPRRRAAAGCPGWDCG